MAITFRDNDDMKAKLDFLEERLKINTRQKVIEKAIDNLYNALK